MINRVSKIHKRGKTNLDSKTGKGGTWPPNDQTTNGPLRTLLPLSATTPHPNEPKGSRCPLLATRNEERKGEPSGCLCRVGRGYAPVVPNLPADYPSGPALTSQHPVRYPSAQDSRLRTARHLRTLASLAVLVSAMPVAYAQDPQTTAQQEPPKDAVKQDKTTAKKADQTKKGAKTADDKPDKPEKPETNLPKLDLGAATWGLSGNEHKFRQYATPAKGVFLRDLYYWPYSKDLRYDAQFNVQTPWDDDYRLTGALRLNYGNTIFTGTNYRNRFFDPTNFVIDPSERQISEGFLRQKLTRNIALSVGSKEDQQDQIFAAPKDPLHQRTRTWDAKLQGNVFGADSASIGFTDWHYFDRTEVLPDSHLTQWNLNYAHQFLPNLDVNGSFTNSSIQQPSMSGSNVQEWGFGGGWDIGDTTNLLFKWRGEHISLPNVANAYDRDRQQTTARLVQSWRNWTAELGYNLLGIDRVRADHLFVDTPSFHTFSGRLSGRLSPWARLTASASRETLQGSAGMDTDNPLALYWRNIGKAQVKLDAFADNVDGYAIVSFMDESNDARATSVHSRIFTYGGSWQTRPDLNLYFESTNDWWSARSGDPQAASLGLYFPNASVFVVGANWNANASITATANLSQFWTDNANPLYLPGGNVRGRFISTGLTYRFVNGDELGVVFAPFRYTDRTDTNQNYETALFGVTGRFKF